MSETSVSGIVFLETRLKSVGNILFLLKNSCVWPRIILSIIFDKMGSGEMGRKFSGSVLESFLKKWFDFCNFTTSRK